MSINGIHSFNVGDDFWCRTEWMNASSQKSKKETLGGGIIVLFPTEKAIS
jgi:hypothetical protein